MNLGQLFGHLKRSAALNLLEGLFFFWNISRATFRAFITAFYFIGNAILLLIMSDTGIPILKSNVQSIWQSLRKKLAAGSRIAADAQGDLRKRQDFLPVRNHGSGGDGEQNKKGIDVLRMGSAGGGRGKNGHLKVVVSASASEGAIVEQPVHSGALANGGGAGAVEDLKKRQDFLPVWQHGWGGNGEQNKKDPKMKKAAPPFSYDHKSGSCKEKGEIFQMAFGERRSLPVQSLVVLFLVGGMPVFASASFTLVHYNNCPIPIFPSLFPTGSSMKIDNSMSLGAIDPSEVQNYTLPDGWAGFGFFSTGCTLDALAARNCTTGNCEGRGCTAEDSPVATTYIISDDGSITISAGRGYNLELEIMPMCVGCTSASCKAQLESCPNDLRLLNSSGAVVGCKPPGRGLHFSESQCTIPGDYGISTVRITCPLKNCITKITVSCQH
ncbi:hypothetical protein EUGRSUZ_F02784 [Eucalyptus grandis]|uniref:Uncharacterized protein n=1 Tax=Eucalyptus grandis TaxID=71139 RepID=A0ACC3KJ62_EUCGR|nr:hypothetical protein EUGRSUZ_F02784 [Eucalyptus grandis]